MSDWRPIATAQHVRDGTVADLMMASGRVYKAAWTWRGNRCAWWPLTERRAQPIALYEPVSWRPVECVTATKQWART